MLFCSTLSRYGYGLKLGHFKVASAAGIFCKSFLHVSDYSGLMQALTVQFSAYPS